jgi:hypothetical protein
MARFMGRMDWGDWFRGIIAGFVGGGSGAISSGVVLSLIDSDHFNAAHPGKVLEIMGGMFLVNGILTTAAFLHQNPVPALVTETTTKIVSHDPPSSKDGVTTIVKTTEVTPVIKVQ